MQRNRYRQMSSVRVGGDDGIAGRHGRRGAEPPEDAGAPLASDESEDMDSEDLSSLALDEDGAGRQGWAQRTSRSLPSRGRDDEDDRDLPDEEPPGWGG